MSEQRQDLEAKLLAHHSTAGSFLAAPIADRHPDLMTGARALVPGQVVGKYTISHEIGRGGMGCVYLAVEQPPLKRRVALKVIAPDLAHEPSYRERLRREAEAAAALTDPGICTIYAFEEIDGDLYIASEFLDGGTLRADIEMRQRPAAGEVERTARDLARALASAHRHGIVHRDLKPENVMRTVDGRLKILDFGLALIEPPAGGFASFAAYHTRPGAFMGTPAYMAPEQLNGQRADSRTDVFALGVLVYEYACGTHPFAAEQPLGVMARIVGSEPTPVERWRQDLPPSFVAILNRCLRKEPADRFASASELVDALDRAADSPAPAPLASWWRTHQLIVIALYLLACGLTWQVKEWQPGITTALFIATCIASTVGGMFRGHLLFLEKVNGRGLETERHRARPVTLVFDLAVALALVADGALLSSERPVPAALTLGLGVGVALTRLVVEPATTAATFAQSGPSPLEP
jgi:hypothetical protein